jgi:hypothetical protein
MPIQVLNEINCFSLQDKNGINIANHQNCGRRIISKQRKTDLSTAT